MPKVFRSPDQIRVLLVDDAPMILTMLSSLLLSLGFRSVTTADSVKAAIEKLPAIDRCPFDLVFLDLYLRDGTGHEILKAIRDKDKEIPIIMLTQEDEAKKVVDTIAQGASDYIVKPFTEELVIKKLERAIGRALR